MESRCWAGDNLLDQGSPQILPPSAEWAMLYHLTTKGEVEKTAKVQFLTGFPAGCKPEDRQRTRSQTSPKLLTKALAVCAKSFHFQLGGFCSHLHWRPQPELSYWWVCKRQTLEGDVRSSHLITHRSITFQRKSPKCSIRIGAWVKICGLCKLTTESVVVVVLRPPNTGPYVVFTLDSRKFFNCIRFLASSAYLIWDWFFTK